MKSKILLFVFAGLVLGACGVMGIRGSGKVREEKRTVQEFSRIEASGMYSVKVFVGEDPSLKISAEENLLKYIRTKISGNTLIIDTKKSISPRKKIKIEITTPTLEGIESSGANNVDIENIASETFYADLSGAGNIVLSGTTEKLRADISGAGNINAKYLEAVHTRVSVSGAASADVFAKGSIEATVSGVGSINYYGNPKDVNTNVSGIGSISRK